MIITSMMDVFFGYNGRVGDVQSCRQGIQEYTMLSQTAETPELREYYAKSAQNMRENILPKMESEMKQLAHQLGVKGEKLGQVMSLEELETRKGPSVFFQREDKDTLQFMKAYQPGEYFYESS
ncbi:lipase chaperone [Algicola sagamiensis]|uniref:lipase chaperone n=1 Tax=Algicola sagamiensis TaxID=163869 RepID=UPI00058F9C55|nr:lipase chaperone [Algicola sagamiensis]